MHCNELSHHYLIRYDILFMSLTLCSIERCESGSSGSIVQLIQCVPSVED